MGNLKDVPNHKGYFCSEDGRLFSNRKGGLKEVLGSPDKDGYLKVTLVRDDGKIKYYRKHRVIALTFLGHSSLQVNHKDLNKQNNSLSNLEYVSQRENQSHRRIKNGYEVGVCWDKKSNKWRAYIQENKKWEHLGFFNKKENAKKAYNKRLNELNLKNKYTSEIN